MLRTIVGKNNFLTKVTYKDNISKCKISIVKRFIVDRGF